MITTTIKNLVAGDRILFHSADVHVRLVLAWKRESDVHRRRGPAQAAATLEIGLRKPTKKNVVFRMTVSQDSRVELDPKQMKQNS